MNRYIMAVGAFLLLLGVGMMVTGLMSALENEISDANGWAFLGTVVMAAGGGILAYGVGSSDVVRSSSPPK